MNGLTYTKNIRHTDPDEDSRRWARFKVGWDRGADDHIYGEAALSELTWENLGNRLAPFCVTRHLTYKRKCMLCASRFRGYKVVAEMVVIAAVITENQ